MKKALLILLIVFTTTLPAFAAPTGTTGPWGIDAGGFKNLSTALSSPSTTGKTVVVSKSMAINNKTVSGNRTLRVIAGGRIDVSAGKTLNFATDSAFDSDDYQAFAGTGTVTNLKGTRPEWFGAKGDGTTNDGPAFQKALSALAQGGRLTVLSKSYLINTQIISTRSDITVDLGSTVILNTSQISNSTWENQGICPIFLFNADRVTVVGGYFKDCKSQGLFSGGLIATHKNGFTVIGTRFSGLQVTGDNYESKCVQARHVDNVQYRGIVAENIGISKATRYSPTLSINYSDGASITDCIVTGEYEGGAANMLYVTKGSVTGNRFTGVSNTLGGQQNLVFHIKYSSDITVSGNVFTGTGGGMKVSEDVKHIAISNNYIKTTGVYQTDYYAGIYFQGAHDLSFTGNVVLATPGRAIYVSPHLENDPSGCLITGNYIRANYNADTDTNEAPVTYGSAVQVNGGNLANPRGPIVISNNQIHNGDVWIFQTTKSIVKGNCFTMDMDMFNNTVSFSGTALTVSGGSAIWDESGTYNSIVDNVMTITTAAPAVNRIGIRLMATTYGVVARNSVRFKDGTTLSYDYIAQASTTGMVWDKNVSSGAVNVEKVAGNAYFGANGTPSATVPGAAFIYDGSQSVDLKMSSPSTGGDVLVNFYNPNGSVGTITTSGSATAYNTSSDYRLKKDVTGLTGSGAFIDGLIPRKWNWKVDGSAGVGFIAHELQVVAPQSVTGHKDEVDSEGNPVYQAVAYGSPEIIANLVAEVQSLRRRLSSAGIQ